MQEKVELKNITSTACAMFGYPGLGLLDPGGVPQPLVVQRSVGAGQQDPAIPVATVTLVPGGTASFWIEWKDVAGSASGSLEITPPNQTTQMLEPNTGLPLHVGTVTVSAVTRGVIASGPSPSNGAVTTDGTYADSYWPGYPKRAFTSLAIPIEIARDPVSGPDQVPPAYFWATQFFAIGSCQCSNGNGGYIGLQKDKDGERVLIAWWSATNANTTNLSAGASQFNGAEGYGARIELPFHFVERTTYHLLLTRTATAPRNTSWLAKIDDTSAVLPPSILGTITVPNSWGTALQGATTSFTEYYGPRPNNCSRMPAATADFGPLLMNGLTASSAPSFSYGPGGCSTSQVALSAGGYSQTVGS